MKYYFGSGVVNTLINKLPFELHLPGYNYCGPGTKLQTRLARGDQGVNALDESCRKHDIAYAQNKNLELRHKADSILGKEAWKRVKSKDASIGERLSALGVAGVMKAKVKLGMGLSKKNSISNQNLKKCLQLLQKVKKSSEGLVNDIDKSIKMLQANTCQFKNNNNNNNKGKSSKITTKQKQKTPPKKKTSKKPSQQQHKRKIEMMDIDDDDDESFSQPAPSSLVDKSVDSVLKLTTSRKRKNESINNTLPKVPKLNLDEPIVYRAAAAATVARKRKLSDVVYDGDGEDHDISSDKKQRLV